MINTKLTKTDEKAIIEIELDGNVLPEEMQALQVPDPIKEEIADKLIVISGRGPIWLYCFLTHKFHPCKAVAVFDPRLGAVIVESHCKEYDVGTIIKM